MFLRWIFTAILIYMIYRFFMRLLAKGNKSSGPRQRPQFDPNSNGTDRGNHKKNLDQIEDAEFEDITEKEKK
jgi:hypothetical protein